MPQIAGRERSPEELFRPSGSWEEPNILPGSSSLADLPPVVPDMAGRLRQISDGFHLAQVFYTALDLDLFSYLKTPASAYDLADRLGGDPDLLEVMLGVLVSSTILEKRDGRYVIAPEMQPFLLPESPYYAHYLTYTAMNRHYWYDLKARIRRRPGASLTPKFTGDTPDSVRYTGRSALLGRLQATMRIIREHLDTSQVRSILDLGGGHGLFSISCAQEFPDAMVTLIDLPEICDIARAQIHYSGFSDRIRVEERDFLTHPLGGPYDLILDLGAFGGDKEETAAWFKKISGSLGPNGWYVRSAFTLDDCRTKPAMTLLFEIEERVSGRDKRHLTNSEVSGLLSNAGVDLIHAEDLTLVTGVPVRVMVARRS